MSIYIPPTKVPNSEIKIAYYEHPHIQLCPKDHFPHPYKEPLPPLVKAYYFEEKLMVYAAILLNTSQGSAIQLEVVYGGFNLTPIFYINYNRTTPNHEHVFLYTVHCNIPLTVKPEIIETFVLNDDPAASRGTITTVQSTT